jgi:hypothetical protein
VVKPCREAFGCPVLGSRGPRRQGGAGRSIRSRLSPVDPKPERARPPRPAEPTNPAAAGNLLSAPDRIRTCDLRFRSGPSGARVGLVSGDSVARGAVQGGRIWRVWDEVRDEVASAGDAACRCPRTHTMTARHHSRFSRKGAARSRPRARCFSSVVATVAGRHADASAHAFKQKRGRVATSARPLADSPIKKAPCL